MLLPVAFREETQEKKNIASFKIRTAWEKRGAQYQSLLYFGHLCHG